MRFSPRVKESTDSHKNHVIANQSIVCNSSDGGSDRQRPLFLCDCIRSVFPLTRSQQASSPHLAMQIECINVCPISMLPATRGAETETAQMLPLKFVPLNVFKGKQGHKIASATKGSSQTAGQDKMNRGSAIASPEKGMGWPSSASPSLSLHHSLVRFPLSPLSPDFLCLPISIISSHEKDLQRFEYERLLSQSLLRIIDGITDSAFDRDGIASH